MMNIVDHLPHYYMVVAKRGLSPRYWVAFVLERHRVTKTKIVATPIVIDAGDERARLQDADVRPLWNRLQEMDPAFWLNRDINKASLELLKIEPVARSVDTSKL